jgi:hypothetical protein
VRRRKNKDRVTQRYHFGLVDFSELCRSELAYSHRGRPDGFGFSTARQGASDSLGGLMHPSIALAHDECLQVRGHEVRL